MSYNPTAPGGPVVCPSNAVPAIDRTKSQCGQTIQVPSGGLWYTLYVTAIRGDTTFGVDPGKLVQVYPSPEISISAGQWDCDPTVFSHILQGSTCWYKFFVKQPSTTGSVKFVLTAGGDSCTVYFAPQGVQPTPSPTPSPPQPQPTAPSCDAYFPPPCDRPGYTCIMAMGICCCKKLAQPPPPPPGPSPTAPPQPPQPSPCPSGTSCLDYGLCEAIGGTCVSDCGVGCCCRKTSPPAPQPTPSPTPSPSPPPAPTPSPSPKPECPAGTVCVDPGLCGGGGTCVSSCSLGCCCQPPSNVPPPPMPAPQPPGRKPGAF